METLTVVSFSVLNSIARHDRKTRNFDRTKSWSQGSVVNAVGKRFVIIVVLPVSLGGAVDLIAAHCMDFLHLVVFDRVLFTMLMVKTRKGLLLIFRQRGDSEFGRQRGDFAPMFNHHRVRNVKFLGNVTSAQPFRQIL